MVRRDFVGATPLDLAGCQDLWHPEGKHCAVGTHGRHEGRASVTALGHDARKSAGSIILVDQVANRVVLQGKGKGFDLAIRQSSH